MRLPRLSSFFHRRTKSDPEVARFVSPPIATLETRNVSSTCIMDLPSPSADVLISHTLPTSAYHAEATNTISPFLCQFSDSLTADHSASALAFTVEHVRNPDANSEDDDRASVRVCDLERALQAERIAREVAEEACFELNDKVAALHDEIAQLRHALFSAITPDGPSTPTSSSVHTGGRDRSLWALSAKDTTLVAEGNRLRSFVELMIAVDGHKPVIDAAYQRILHGEDAEAALVAAIKHAVTRPDSVWRRVLEPVTGVRTQEEYLAQLRCTLDARKQTQVERKRASFWKRAAKEEGRNGATVTPSSSAISDVLSARTREEGDLSPRVLPATDADAAAARTTAADPVGRSLVSSTSGAQPDFDAVSEFRTRLANALSEIFDPDLPANSSSMVLPGMLSSVSTARTISTYNNLPPLASEAFRASHSIKSISSRGMRRGISTSASTLTHGSGRSRRWHARLATVPSVDTIPSSTSSESLPQEESKSTVAEDAEEEAVVEAPRPITPPFTLPKALVDFGTGSDEDLVLILHNDFADTSFRPTPVPQTRATSTSWSSTPSSSETSSSSGASTPERKSRLPVRMPGLKTIKRLSMSVGLSHHAFADVTHTATGMPATSLAAREDDVTFGRAIGTGASGTARRTGSVPASKIPTGRWLR